MPATKNVRLNEQVKGESLPLSTTADAFSATPSPRGSTPKTPEENIERKLNFIDLFAGCGGLSEGFLSTEKYNALAHVEWELPMVNTLRERLVEKWNHSEEEAKRRVVRFDIQKTEELIHGSWSEESKKIYEKDNASLVVNGGLRSVVGEQPVDLIIGGPPCQAYSIAGRAQSPTKMQDDYRNYLFESYAKVVDHFKPKLFVFENVPGLLTACPGGKPVKNRIFEAFEEIGYEIRNPADLKNAVYCAEDFDVPQKRNRVIILGIKKGLNLNLDDFYSALNREKKSSKKTVKDAIGNLPELIPTGKVEKVGRVHVSHKQTCGELVENHTPRYHGFRDQKLFREWLSNSMNSFSSEEKKEFYTKITGHKSNHIKYRNLEWDKPSPTIVAHLYKDGYMFIHPDINQLRTITVREAALLQTFPSDYRFSSSTSYNYKMIGNAVPVLFAKGIAESIYKVFSNKDGNK